MNKWFTNDAQCLMFVRGWCTMVNDRFSAQQLTIDPLMTNDGESLPFRSVMMVEQRLTDDS